MTKSFSTSYKSGDVPKVGLMNYITKNYGQPVTDPPSARLETTHLYTPNRKPERREEAAYGGGRYLGTIPLLIALVELFVDPKKHYLGWELLLLEFFSPMERFIPLMEKL